MFKYLFGHFHLGLPGVIGLCIGGVGLTLFGISVFNSAREGARPLKAIADAPGGTSVLDTLDRLTDLFKVFDYIEYQFGAETFRGDGSVAVMVQLLRAFRWTCIAMLCYTDKIAK